MSKTTELYNPSELRTVQAFGVVIGPGEVKSCEVSPAEAAKHCLVRGGVLEVADVEPDSEAKQEGKPASETTKAGSKSGPKGGE